jgi:hypothetical protein
MLALIDMRGNLLAAVIVLVFGVIAWRMVRSTQPMKRRLPMVPLVAFACGPLIAFLCYLIEVFWVSRGQEFLPREYVSTFVSIMTIGVLGGLAGAIAFAIGSFAPAGQRQYDDDPQGQHDHPAEGKPEP